MAVKPTAIEVMRDAPVIPVIVLSDVEQAVPLARALVAGGIRMLEVTLRTAAREYLIEESLARLEQEYGERFVRVHRNCLVARAAIRGFERSSAEGEGSWLALLGGCDEKIPVSRRQQYIVRELGRS